MLAKASDRALWVEPIREIILLHGEVLVIGETARKKAIRIGEIFTQVKGSVGHGNWLPWIKQYIPFSDEWVRVYMRAYEERDNPKFQVTWNLSQHQLGNGSRPNGEQQLHEPNFHSQAIRIEQNFMGLFTHYLQRRPLKVWHTEEIYDLLCSLKPLHEVVAQLEIELITRSDAPASYRQSHAG